MSLLYSPELQFQLLLDALFSQLNEKANDMDKTYNHLYSCFLFCFLHSLYKTTQTKLFSF